MPCPVEPGNMAGPYEIHMATLRPDGTDGSLCGCDDDDARAVQVDVYTRGPCPAFPDSYPDTWDVIWDVPFTGPGMGERAQAYADALHLITGWDVDDTAY